jgi:hypothetical protein
MKGLDLIEMIDEEQRYILIDSDSQVIVIALLEI